jgi:hypothetical protein
MFNFAPPAKVARTQRSSVSQASIQHHHHDVSSSVTSRPPTVPSSLSQRTIEFPENPTAVLRQQQLASALSRGNSAWRTIAGIGNRVAWTVDETSVQIWTVDCSTGSLQGPAFYPAPTFDSVGNATTTTNIAAFAAEWESEETILVCSKSGVVRSLDSRVEFEFASDDVAIEISAFAVLGAQDQGTSSSSCLVVAGTTSGLVLSYNVRSTEEDAGVLDTLNAPQALATATGTGWLSWLTGGRGSTAPSNRKSNNRAAAAVGIERLTASTTTNHHLWVVQGGHQVLLVDIAAGVTQFQILFAVDLESSIGAKGEVLGLESIVDGALLVYRYFDTRSEKDALALVAIAAKSGSVSSVTALSGLGSLITNKHGGGLAAAKGAVVALSSRANQGHDVTLVFGACAIRVHNAAGVRHPCTSEDVTVLTRRDGGSVSAEYLLAAKVINDGRGDVLLLDTQSGPYVGSPDASRSVAAAGHGSDLTPTFGGHRNGGELLATPGGGEMRIHISQRIAGILSASRVDARATVDEVVLNVVDDILQNTPLHAANWARVDLHSEDINLFTYVTRNLVFRQEEHQSLVQELFRRHRDDTWSKLSHSVVASLVSVQEQLRCLVEIRRLQNDIRSINEVTVTALIAAATSQPQQQQLAVKQTAAIVSSAAEEHSQELLRKAIVDVADVLRAEALSSNGIGGGLPSTASSAEITFGKAENICMILRRLNTIVSETWVMHNNNTSSSPTNAGGTGTAASYVAEVEARVRLTLAASFVFASILGHVHSGRSTTTADRSHESSSQRAGVEEIDRDDVGPIAVLRKSANQPDHVLAEIAQSLNAEPSGKDALWTSGVAGGASGFEAALLDQALLLSDALAALCNNAMTTGGGGSITGSSRSGLVALQQAVLDMLTVMLDSLLSFSSTASFSADLIRRSLLRQPFVAQNVGFPFGSPASADNHSLVAASSIRKAVLAAAESFAMQYRLYDIMFLFAAGDYHPDPESSGSHFATMRTYIAMEEQRAAGSAASSEFLPYCIEALVAQDREPELLALPALLADFPSAAAGGTSDIQNVRDELLRQYAPHLHWQTDPTAFYSLREEGAQGNPNVPYGSTALEHRSRCLSMAKLGWIAHGAPVTGHYDDVVTDELIVDAQRSYLSDPNVASRYGPNEVLTTTEAVQRLVAVATASSPSSSTPVSQSNPIRYWELAAAIASRTPLPLRGELSALLLREALASDGVEALLSIPADAVSERELLARFSATVTGRVLLSSPCMRTDYHELGNTIQRALAHHSNHNAVEQQVLGERLSVTLTNWIALRATNGCV